MKINAEKEKINDLTEIDVILIKITISLVIHILFLIAIIVFWGKYEKWLDNYDKYNEIDQIKALERLINANKNYRH